MKMSESAFTSFFRRTTLISIFRLGTSCQLSEFCYQLITVAMLLMMALTSQTTLAATPDSRCSIDNGLVADEMSCRRFIICLKGLVRPLECSRDLLFNRDRLTCDFPSNVHCGNRPLEDDGNTCYTAKINVTVSIRNEVKEPLFQAKVVVRAPRQPLRFILLIAAGMDSQFRYETQGFEGYGDYVSSFNGLENDVVDQLAVWMPHDKDGDVIAENLDHYVPENDDVITYVYTKALR